MDRRSFMGGVAVTGVLTSLGGPARAQEEIKITVSAGHPPAFLWIKHVKESLIKTVDAELAKGGKYKITWNEAYGSTLAKIGSELETVEQGISDMGIVASIFHSAKLPLQNVTISVPFGPTDPELVTEAVDELHKVVPALNKSWDRHNQINLSAFAVENYCMVTNFPVNKLEDLKGRKISGAGPNLNWIKGTGAVGVVGSLNSWYNDIKAGVYDGALIFATGAVAGKLYEVAPYFVRMDFGAMWTGGFNINKARWNRFPEPVKAAFREAGKVFRTNYLIEQSSRAASAMETWTQNKGTVITVAPDERIRIAKSITNPTVEWIKAAEAKGEPAKQVLTAYMNIIRRRGGSFARDFDKE